MYKAASLAVLLTLLAFMAGSKSSGSVPVNLTTPMIVASGRLLNQKGAFSQTIYTPGVSGVFRLSVYATITTADPASSSDWSYGYSWTDASGTLQNVGLALIASNAQLGAFIDGASFGNGISTGGFTRTFQANKAMPIIHFTGEGGSPDNSAYSVYYVLERLE
jgi:hypothetical protein